MKKTTVMFLLMAASAFAQAEVEEKKTINAIHVNKNGNYWVNLNDPGPSLSCGFTLLVLKSPTVQTNDMVFQAWYSGLLAALRSGSPVTIDYTNCVVDQIHFY